MGALNVIKTPEPLIAAYQEGAAVFEFSFSDTCNMLIVEIYANKTYQKEFSREELSQGKVTINVQKYIQRFAIADKAIYSPLLELMNSYIRSQYSVKVTASFANSTETYNFNGTAICSVYFEGGAQVEKIPLQNNSGIFITDNFGTNIYVKKQ